MWFFWSLSLLLSLAIKLSMLKTAVNIKRLRKHYRQCHMQLANFLICVIYPDQLELRSNASSILKMSLFERKPFFSQLLSIGARQLAILHVEHSILMFRYFRQKTNPH